MTRLQRSFAKTALYLLAAGIVWHSFNQPIPDFKQGKHSYLTLRYVHPMTVSPGRTEKELTRRLENILLNIEGIKRIESISRKSMGMIRILTVRNTTQIESEIVRQIRLNSASFPPRFRLPEINNSQDNYPASIRLNGDFPSSAKLRNSLAAWVRSNGIPMRWKGIPEMQTEPVVAREYQSFLANSHAIPKEVQSGQITLKNTFAAWKNHHFRRYENQVNKTKSRTLNAPLRINGQPAVTLEARTSSAELINIVRKWPHAQAQMHHMYFSEHAKLWQIPVLSWWVFLIVLFTIIRCSFSQCLRPVDDLVVWLTAGSFILMIISGVRDVESYRILICFLFLIPIARVGSPLWYTPRMTPLWSVFPMILIAAAGLKYINFNQQSTLSAYESKSSPFITATLQLKNPHPKTHFRNYVQFLEKEYKNQGLFTSLESTGNSYVFSITGAKKRLQTVRKDLIRRALNSADVSWFIETPGMADFSTFPSPIYPSVQWMLSSSSSRKLDIAVQNLKSRLQQTSHVSYVQEVGGDSEKPSNHFYYRQSAPLDDQENRTFRLFPSKEKAMTGLFSTGIGTIRGRNLFIQADSRHQSIRKIDGEFVKVVGHEFYGSGRMEEKFRRRMTSGISRHFPDVSVNKFKSAKVMDPERLPFLIFGLTMAVLIISAFIFGSFRQALYHSLHQLAFIYFVFLFHQSLDIPLPMQPVSYIIIGFCCNYLFNLILSPPLIVWSATIGIVCLIPGSYLMAIPVLPVALAVFRLFSRCGNGFKKCFYFVGFSMITNLFKRIDQVSE